MPVLKNPRHERMAQGLAKGLSAEKAHVEAGFKQNRHNAAALAREEHISTRVTELQSKAVKKVEITVDSLASELEEARAMALKEKQTSAAVSATMGKAKLFGGRAPTDERHHPDRQHHHRTFERADPR
jgi:hypothetical protein